MRRSKSNPMTEAQANLLLAEVAVVAISSAIAIGGSIKGWLQIKRKATEVIDEVT